MRYRTRQKEILKKIVISDRFGGFKQMVLERDNFSCVQCNMTENEHIEKFGEGISIDHIDRNRKNNTMDNLQTLCLDCHRKKDNKR